MLNNLRESLRPCLEKIGRGFAGTGLPPNFWTSVALAFAFLSAIVYGLNVEFTLIIGGILLLVSGFFDIAELNPTYDNGATASLAAKIMSTMIALNLKR